MDCHECGETMRKDFARSIEYEGPNTITVVWAAECPNCGHECDILEEFDSTGYEEEC